MLRVVLAKGHGQAQGQDADGGLHRWNEHLSGEWAVRVGKCVSVGLTYLPCAIMQARFSMTPERGVRNQWSAGDLADTPVHSRSFLIRVPSDSIDPSAAVTTP